MLTGENSSVTKEVFGEVPLDDKACGISWTDLCAFELNGVAWRPSARSALQTWKALLLVLSAQGVKPTQQFLLKDICTAMQDDGFPGPLTQAVIRRLAAEEQAADPRCKKILTRNFLMEY